MAARWSYAPSMCSKTEFDQTQSYVPLFRGEVRPPPRLAFDLRQGELRDAHHGLGDVSRVGLSIGTDPTRPSPRDTGSTSGERKRRRSAQACSADVGGRRGTRSSG